MFVAKLIRPQLVDVFSWLCSEIEWSESIYYMNISCTKLPDQNTVLPDIIMAIGENNIRHIMRWTLLEGVQMAKKCHIKWHKNSHLQIDIFVPIWPFAIIEEMTFCHIVVLVHVFCNLCFHHQAFPHIADLTFPHTNKQYWTDVKYRK